MSIPMRSEVNPGDCWNLASLFASDADWEAGLLLLKAEENTLEKFRGTLSNGPETLRLCLETANRIELLDERLGYYSFLRLAEDAGDSHRQGMQGRYTQVAVTLQAAASFIQPELLALDAEVLKGYFDSPELEHFRIPLEKMLRYKPHTLSSAEERLLAMQAEASQAASRSFRALTDVDMTFGIIETPEGSVNLSQSSYSGLQMHPDRSVRERSFSQFYQAFDNHKNTLASLYSGSIQLDSYHARIRNHSGSLEAALFHDKVPVSVYDNLIETVHNGLPALHRYYALRRRKMGLQDLALWDTKTSLVAEVKTKYTFDEAISTVLASLAPLGSDYVENLERGLKNGWVDRYENKGKRSGAFSAGSYAGWPYILMNYKENVLRDMFTLAHEAGHSMHSWYSVRNNPFQYYKYSIFEAEVASTFNEQLLFTHLMNQNPSREMQTYLVNKQIDDIIATLYRQTMFAEYEQIMHRLSENGSGLTLDSFRGEYLKLLKTYFGPEVSLHELADLEGLRIPHFYSAFYVYKYATGIAASISLSAQVLAGKTNALQRYQAFLNSGGSSYPIENLSAAGVDLSSPQPIRDALGQFAGLLDQLEQLLK